MPPFGTVAAVLLVLVGLAAGAGLWLALRRPAAPIRSMAGAPFRSSLRQLQREANLGLVAVDNALAEAEAELGFAEAQFGGDAAVTAFAEAVATGRRELGEAFAIRQRLDDPYPESEQRQRESNKQIIGIVGRIRTRLAEHQRAFTELRHRELGAEDARAALGAAGAALTERLGAGERAASAAAERFDDPALAALPGLLEAAAQAAAAADRALDQAAKRRTASPTASVVRLLEEAERQQRTATAALETAERLIGEQEQALGALEQLVASGRKHLTQTKTLPALADGALAQTIDSAAARLERVLLEAAAPEPARRPLEALRRIETEAAALDSAVREVRNEQQRRRNASDALEGARVIANSQLGLVRDLLAGGRVGAEARTRLAEAERQLALGAAEDHPVAALDAVRRAISLANDAEALARYDLLGMRLR